MSAQHAHRLNILLCEHVEHPIVTKCNNLQIFGTRPAPCCLLIWHHWCLCTDCSPETFSAKQCLCAGGDEPPEDINKLKTKVRRLYDIANVLTSLNLIAKVHLKPARRPAFQWLGIDGICIQPQQREPAAVTHLPTSLSAFNPSPSEDISSTATGSSVQEQTLLRHTSSCTQLESNINTTQADSQSTSNRCLKRNAAGLEPSSSQKRNRTGQLQRSPNPPQLSYGTVNSPSRPPPLVPHEQCAQSGKVDTSPAVDQQPKSGRQGTRPTPVPITPEGGQTDVQRHKVRTPICIRLALVHA